MSVYKLKEFSFGSNHLKDIVEFETKGRIDDVSYCEIRKELFFVIRNCGVGRLNSENKINYLPYFSDKKPISICFKGHGVVLGSGGRKVYEIFVNDLRAAEMLSEVVQRKHMSLLKNVSEDRQDLFIRCCFFKNNNNEFLFSHSTLNSCFKVSLSDSDLLIEQSSPRASFCSSARYCHLNAPMGIAQKDDEIYICDSGSHCIRKMVDDKAMIFAGNVGKNNFLKCPRDIKINSSKVCFIDDEGVKFAAISNGKNCNLIYPSEKKCCIDFKDSASLLILEEICPV